jgi:hypothetical protein
MAKCAARRKPQAALIAPLVLQYTRIDKCAMKIFGINGQLQNKHFFIAIHRFSLVKGAMNAFVKCAMVLKKGLNFLNKVRNEYSPHPCCTIANLKTRRRSKTLKGSQRMGGGHIVVVYNLSMGESGPVVAGDEWRDDEV